MKKKNSNWYYCNICGTIMRQKEKDGLCINCHLYLCLEPDPCSRCLGVREIIDLLVDLQKGREADT